MSARAAVRTSLPVLPAETAREVVGLACLAPSIHNTQPWSWRAVGRTLELHADPRRRLRAADPSGRQLVISCGAALHQARVAATALGWGVEVTRVRDGQGSTLLATLALTPASPPPDAGSLIAGLRERRTDRRRFTAWPVPEDRLQRLVGDAADLGVAAFPLLDVAPRFRLDLLMGRALDVEAADPRFATEQAAWIGHGDHDGIPRDLVPARDARTSTSRSRFGGGRLEDAERDLAGSDAVVVLATAYDDVPSWLRAGEALSALWLRAGADGLSVVPLSQVVEVPETRSALQQELLGTTMAPQLLVRVGWQQISRSPLPRTSRRPLAEVLRG